MYNLLKEHLQDSSIREELIQDLFFLETYKADLSILHVLSGYFLVFFELGVAPVMNLSCPGVNTFVNIVWLCAQIFVPKPKRFQVVER